jgi:serine/threonine protein kinase
MPTHIALADGQIFAGRYRVVRLLKAGGMGAVYEVRHTQNGKRWALKIMHAEVGADAQAQQRFAQEAQIDGIIGSTHVFSVIDAGVDAATQTPFLVMEFLVGEELGELVARTGPLPSSRVVTILVQVSRALDKAHQKGIVHRDLKPENLFLARSDEEDERVKILDFGIAKIMSSANRSSTMGGGTPLYMAPEQTRRGHDIGPWTDVWAFGLVAYTLLVGRPYWEVETVGELYGELLTPGSREAPTARAWRAGVRLPQAFDDWFFRCVRNEMEARFRSAGEAAAALAAVFGTTAAAAAPSSASVPPAADLVRTAPMQATPSLASGPPALAGLTEPAGVPSTLLIHSEPLATDAPLARVQTVTGPKRTGVLAAVGGLLAVSLLAGAVLLNASRRGASSATGAGDRPTAASSGAVASSQSTETAVSASSSATASASAGPSATQAPSLEALGDAASSNAAMAPSSSAAFAGSAAGTLSALPRVSASAAPVWSPPVEPPESDWKKCTDLHVHYVAKVCNVRGFTIPSGRTIELCADPSGSVRSATPHGFAPRDWSANCLVNMLSGCRVSGSRDGGCTTVNVGPKAYPDGSPTPEPTPSVSASASASGG